MIDYPEFPVVDDPRVIYEADIYDPETQHRKCEIEETCGGGTFPPQDMVFVPFQSAWACGDCYRFECHEYEEWNRMQR